MNLVVDLDGSLLGLDSTIAMLLSAARNQPFKLAKLIISSLRFGSRLRFKEDLFELCNLDISSLLLNPKVMEVIQNCARNKYRIILATASQQKLADSLVKDLNLFDSILASTAELRNGGIIKLHRVQAVISGPFCYIGNDFEDLHLWKYSSKAYIVTNSKSLVKAVKAVQACHHNVEVIDAPTRKQIFVGYLKILRKK